jgi:glycosyltransferase A (GT-A) superfamily protein (DUF2064 family)
MTPHLTVIAKRPIAGAVKTRLCPPCTPVEAAEVAAAGLADTMDGIDELTRDHSVPARRVLLFDGDPAGWERPGWTVAAQVGGPLDRRLCAAFESQGPGVIIGMETPHAVAALAGALRAIGRGHDALGLTNDGGYWAIGLHRHDPLIFDDVPMSTSVTGLAQLRAMHRAGHAVMRLPFARDLDTFDDVRAAAQRAGTGRLDAVARELVERHG